MGVLDEAIREHLELKRRRGASEVELARAEEEALGPARRPVAPSSDDEHEAAATDRSHDETLIVPPVEDVAPPPPLEESDFGYGEPTRAVHDIDEDPLAPPAPVPRDDSDDEAADDEPPGEEPGGQRSF